MIPPRPLGLGAQVRVVVTGDKGSLFMCPYCDRQIGRYTGDDGEVQLSAHHDAPCGLRCAGSASRHWTEECAPMHTGPHTCVRCIPVACPTCNGRKLARTDARTALRSDPDNEPLRRLAAADPSALAVVKCPTCKGVGGVEAYRTKKFD